MCIVNGEPVKRIEIEQGKAQGEFALKNIQKYNFARVEIYDDKDILIALSNPVYLVEDERDIPLDVIESGRSKQR